MPNRVVNFVLPMPPSANAYWRIMTSNGRSFLYLTGEARQYKKTVESIAALNALMYDEIAIEIRVFRKIKSGDLDNRLKVLLDAMQKVVYDNDSQITQIKAYRFDDARKPRVEVEVREIGPETLFEK